MQYYIIFNDENHGPLDLSQLSEYGLTEESRVWSAGWPSWKNAGDVPEIKEHIDTLARQRVMQEKQLFEQQTANQNANQNANQAATPHTTAFTTPQPAPQPAYQQQPPVTPVQPVTPPKPQPVQKVWYVGIDNVESGPFSEQEMMSIGLQPESLVWCDGMEDWTQAQYVAQLKPYIQYATPAAPEPTGYTAYNATPSAGDIGNIGRPIVMPIVSVAMLAVMVLNFIIVLNAVYFYYFNYAYFTMLCIPGIVATIAGFIKAANARNLASAGRFAEAQRASGAATGMGIIGTISFLAISLSNWISIL